MSEELMRQEFEEWAEKEGMIMMQDGETYYHHVTHRAWIAWQAARTGGEVGPVGWQFYQDGKWWHGYDRIKDHRKNTEEAGFPVRDLYATPQPYPDVSALVEALEDIAQWSERWTAPGHPVATVARKALAAHNKGTE